jgi:hypothetical protein
MTTQELIKRYRISLKIDEHGQPNGNLVVYRADKAALAAIKAAKPEIVAVLLAQREASLRAEQERQAKIDAIPGLREIEAARIDLVNWKLEFDASFDGEGGGGVGVRPKPKYDMDALHAKYPRAKAYLDAMDFAESANDAKAAAGRKALEAIINGENYERAASTMEAEWKSHAASHIWD